MVQSAQRRDDHGQELLPGGLDVWREGAPHPAGQNNGEAVAQENETIETLVIYLQQQYSLGYKSMRKNVLFICFRHAH